MDLLKIELELQYICLGQNVNKLLYTSRRKCLRNELLYYNFRGNLVMLHGKFNNSLTTLSPIKHDLERLISLYDLSLFNLNTSLDPNLNPFENLSCQQIRSRYFSPLSFEQMKSKMSINERYTSFSFFTIIS